MNPESVIRYDRLRDDWVKGGDLIARLVVRSAQNEVLLQGFPRQWVPLFVHFAVRWQNSTAPSSFVAIASDLTEVQLCSICARAQQKGALRTLVEAFAALDPLVADVLYRLDRRVELRTSPKALHYLPLTGWQSYGRPEVLALNRRITASACAKRSTAVLLPCARRRPYTLSKTHRRIWRALKADGIDPANVDQLVVSSIGIVPEALWNDPVVLAYDSGVPDIYRILRLMRLFFRKVRYDTVIDCLEFRPYSDCLAILSREELLGSLRSAPKGRPRALPEP